MEAHAHSSPRLPVGIDLRPALLGHTGISRSVRQLATALAARPELALHGFAHSLARARREPPQGLRLHRAPLPGRSLPLLRALGLGADRFCGRPRVFHHTDYVHVPIRDGLEVVTIHDLAFAEDPALHGPQAPVLMERTRAMAQRAAAVICPTRASADSVTRHLEVQEDRVRVIPFGVDHVPEAIPARHPRAGQPYLLMLGTVEPRKNHLRALEAWRALGPDRPHLVVIGAVGWECEREVEALLGAVRSGTCSWYRRLDDDLVYAHLAYADALLYPSLLEGFGFPPLEALAYGTPVVAGDTPALREVLGSHATFCDPRDPGSILDAIRSAVTSDRSPRADAKRSAHARGYRWRDCAARHAALYRELVAE